jgi:hypothetical protein
MIQLIKQTEPYEAVVWAQGSHMEIVFGRCHWGNYICLPVMDIGCNIGPLSDNHWNAENLAYTQLSTEDAISIADGLKELSDYISL